MKRKIHLKYVFSVYSIFTAFCMFGVNHSLLSQETETHNISGTIVDMNNQPLPGATITIKGETTGTISDAAGYFSLTSAPNDTLVVDFIGYLTEEVAVDAQSNIEVILIEDIVSLDEVVVVGYGTMRRQDLTGSISSVTSDELYQGVITTTEQALQGKVAGLAIVKGSGDPTQGVTMRLRGGTSLIASSTPLVVIDGIPGADINTIQPSQIESVDVLKDASAAAIYGSRGANGVIMITTTRPKQGTQVEYNSYVAFGKVANYGDILTAGEWRDKVEEQEITTAIDFDSDTDWQKEISRTSVSQSHALSFSKADEQSGFRASLNYMDNEGIIINSYLKRLGASVSAYTHGLNEKLRLDIGAHTTMDDYRTVDYGIFERVYNLNPTAPVRDSVGDYFRVDGTNTENPVELQETRFDDQTRKRVLGFAKAELEIISGLKAALNSSLEYNSHQGRFYLPTYSPWGEGDDGYASRSLGDYTTKQLETYLTYAKEFNMSHRINIMAGYSFLENVYEGFSSERRGYDTDLFLYNNLQAGQDVRSTDVNSYKGKSNLISFFGRANYSYMSKYSITATLRRDGSSRFGENNKWGLFPSLAAAWTISNEDFFSSASTWLNHLKLRVGYGVTGSQEAIGEYNTIALLGSTGSGNYYDSSTNSWRTAFAPTQNANPDLRWEKTTQYNLGIDISILNKLSAQIDIYSKLTEDLIFRYTVPQPPNLYNETLANVGDLSNKGVELSLDYTAISRDELNWNMNLSVARNIMKIEKLSDDNYSTDAVQSGSLHGIRGMSNQYSQTIREGYAIGTFWGYECFGIDSLGQYELDTVKKDLGNAQPKVVLGFNTNVRYKNFDLGISLYGMFGQKVLNATAMALNDPNRFPAQNVPHKLFDEEITESPTYCSYWIEDASFLRLQSLSIGYTFPFSNNYLSKLRLYVSGENLFVITSYSGVDPEIKLEDYNADEGKMSALTNPGIDRFDVYPRARTFTIGLNVTF